MSIEKDIYLSFNPIDKPHIDAINDFLTKEEGITTSVGTEFYDTDLRLVKETYMREQQKLKAANAIVIFMGKAGVDKSQEQIISEALNAEARTEIELYVCLIGKEPTINDIPNALAGHVVHFWPKKMTLMGEEPGIELIAFAVNNMKHGDSPDESDIDRQEKKRRPEEDIEVRDRLNLRISEFKEKAIKEGATIILGTNWNASDELSADQQTRALLTAIYNNEHHRIDVSSTISYESAEAYGALAQLADTYTEKANTDRKTIDQPFIFFDTNVDSSLERELIKMKVPFLTYVPLDDGEYIQTSINNIEMMKDGAFRITCEPQQYDHQDKNKDVSVSTNEYEVDISDGLFYNRKNATELIDGEFAITDEQLLRDISIDLAMKDIRKISGLHFTCELSKTKSKKLNDLADKARMDAIGNFKPIVIKPYGSAQVSERAVYGLDRIFKLDATMNIPEVLWHSIGRSNIAFMGFNVADQNFVYLHSKIFLPRIISNSHRNLLLFIGLKPEERNKENKSLSTMITESLELNPPLYGDFSFIQFLFSKDTFSKVINHMCHHN